LGKWQSATTQSKTNHGSSREYQFEFFADGSVVQNWKKDGRWDQLKAGTFKFVDANHVKIDFGWMDMKPTIYEFSQTGNNQIRLRAGDYGFDLTRVQ